MIKPLAQVRERKREREPLQVSSYLEEEREKERMGENRIGRSKK